MHLKVKLNYCRDMTTFKKNKEFYLINLIYVCTRKTNMTICIAQHF